MRSENAQPSKLGSGSDAECELRLTAALYAARPGVLKHLEETGKLPEQIDMSGISIQMRLLIERRGTDIQLSPDEAQVYDAIRRERRLPGGSVVLLSPDQPKSTES